MIYNFIFISACTSNYKINQIPTEGIKKKTLFSIGNAVRVTSLLNLCEMLVDFKGDV